MAELPGRIPGARLGLAALAVLLAACGSHSAASPSASASASSPAATSSASVSAAPTTSPVGWRDIGTAGGPAPREDHTWTVNGAGTEAYLVGGRAGATVHRDLWVYDLAADTWAQRRGEDSFPVGPEARFGHNAVWVDGVGLVIFAGQGASNFFNDLWAYDPDRDAWTRLPASGAVPVPRYGSCAALGPDGRLWISHGFTSEGTRFADTRAYDFATGTWTDETPAGDAPIERCLHGCWWSDDGFNLYGGQTTGTLALGDWWTLSVGSNPSASHWAEVTIGGEGLPARNLYALTAFRGGHLVFGGQALDGGFLDDTWLIDHERAPAPAPTRDLVPPGRAGAEMLTDLERDRVLLFGGKSASGAVGDLWELTVP